MAKHECTVFERDAVAGGRSKKPPFGVLGLCGDIDRFAPRLPVVKAFGDKELAGLFHAQAPAVSLWRATDESSGCCLS